MNKPDVQQEHPDGPVNRFVLTIEKVADEGWRQTWSVYCPEWKCEIKTHNPLREVSVLMSQIIDHNEECRLLEGKAKP